MQNMLLIHTNIICFQYWTIQRWPNVFAFPSHNTTNINSERANDVCKKYNQRLLLCSKNYEVICALCKWWIISQCKIARFHKSVWANSGCIQIYCIANSSFSRLFKWIVGHINKKKKMLPNCAWYIRIQMTRAAVKSQ